MRYSIFLLIISLSFLTTGNVFSQEHNHNMNTAQKSPGMEQMKTYTAPPEFKAQLDSLFNVYYMLQNAFSRDSLNKVKVEAINIEKTLAYIDIKLLSGDAHMKWMELSGEILGNAKAISQSKDIESARKAFLGESKAIISTAKSFGTSGKLAIYHFHCPMAFDKKGADWLQNTNTAENPYFGKSMFKCGDLTETISKGIK
jgi:membrane fusion protein, copper/silver efflux system